MKNNRQKFNHRRTEILDKATSTRDYTKVTEQSKEFIRHKPLPSLTFLKMKLKMKDILRTDGNGN